MNVAWGPLTDTMQLSSLRTVIAREFAQGFAVRRRAHDLNECLDPMVSRPALRKAEVIELLAYGQELQTCFLAHEAQADPCVGPATTDGLGNAAVIGGQPPGGPAVAEELIQALPCPGPVLAANPPQIGTHGLADGRELLAGCEDNPFVPAGDTE
jgi:hypothetical protein